MKTQNKELEDMMQAHASASEWNPLDSDGDHDNSPKSEGMDMDMEDKKECMD